MSTPIPGNMTFVRKPLTNVVPLPSPTKLADPYESAVYDAEVRLIMDKAVKGALRANFDLPHMVKAEFLLRAAELKYSAQDRERIEAILVRMKACEPFAS